jgi:hypothetical protein
MEDLLCQENGHRNSVGEREFAKRQAVRHLEQGGMVLTGMDHPVHNSKYSPFEA